MEYTAESVKEEIEPDYEEMMKSLEESTEVPAFLKRTEHFKHVWLAGCWLNAKLLSAECPEERVKKIGFEHGQRSFHSDTYRCAAQLFNAFQEGTLEERPGEELARELISANTEKKPDGSIVMRVGSDGMKAQMQKEIDRLRAMTKEELEQEKIRLEEQLRIENGRLEDRVKG